ncbi:MAG: hypothetical protein JWP60_4682 [Ramlibacter sp.]|nr:hypothetical protein [Ramlibacter sp.]
MSDGSRGALADFREAGGTSGFWQVQVKSERTASRPCSPGARNGQG